MSEDLQIYLSPIDGEKLQNGWISSHTDKHFPSLEENDIFIFAVEEERNAVGNKGCSAFHEALREELYKLEFGNTFSKVADLGTIKAGNDVKDTYYAVSKVCEHLLQKLKTVLIIGGSQDITYANYLGYQRMEQTINMLSIDDKLDLGAPEDELDASTFLGNIVRHQPNFLFHFSQIGYQTYLTHEDQRNLFAKLHFDLHRLGEIQADVKLSEPLIRNVDVVSIDLSAVRQSEAPGNEHAGPNGFFGNELCQMVRYAGLSDKVSSIGFYEGNSEFDNRNQTAKLIAQATWCFVEGHSHRQEDFPFGTKKDYAVYSVAFDDSEHIIKFMKSPRSSRWWMEVPYPPNDQFKYQRHFWVPCSYETYQEALKNEIPDLWWKTYKKLV
jgi:arginase family enzyme